MQINTKFTLTASFSPLDIRYNSKLRPCLSPSIVISKLLQCFCRSSVYNYCIPENQGYYGSCTVIVGISICVRRDFRVFNLYSATFLFGFLLNLTNGLLWQRSGHPILLVAQELKLCCGESKISIMLTIARVQAIGHSFFHIYFIFGA